MNTEWRFLFQLGRQNLQTTKVQNVNQFFFTPVERNTRLNESSTFPTCVLLSENKEYADS